MHLDISIITLTIILPYVLILMTTPCYIEALIDYWLYKHLTLVIMCTCMKCQLLNFGSKLVISLINF